MQVEDSLIRINSLKLNTDYTERDLELSVRNRLRLSEHDSFEYKIVRKSLDARRKNDIHYVISVNVNIGCEKRILSNKRIKDVSSVSEIIYNDPYSPNMALKDVDRPIIVGLGPAGLICAYKLAKAGLRPIVLERGADVDTRVKDVEEFWSTGKLNTSSNVQFGEGGAGTFSDGKLNTMIHDNFGRIGEVFRIFTEHGADESIKYLAKPHIGTDKLRYMVKAIREDIVALGGEVRFNSCVTDISVENGNITGVTVNGSLNISCNTLVLAIGHSARDTFYMLNGKCVPMERKAFAAGVRVQHPQSLIGQAQYGDIYESLPSADYKLTYNTAEGRGVYSFCMCPGGFVVNASSEEGLLAVNGMSNSQRDERTANSAIVVSVKESDFPGDSVLGGVELQRELERKCFEEGRGSIPVQYLRDFKNNTASSRIVDNAPNTKGQTVPGNLRNVLPEYISESILEAFPSFGRTIPGFDGDDTMLIGLESRTSSPVRIIRGDNLQSVSVNGLYPCGEGAGYAGGITSAAVDGLKVYEAIINNLV